jgi:hypothetical protein
MMLTGNKAKQLGPVRVALVALESCIPLLEAAQPGTPGFLASEQENCERIQRGVYWSGVEKQKGNSYENDFCQVI